MEREETGGGVESDGGRRVSRESVVVESKSGCGLAWLGLVHVGFGLVWFGFVWSGLVLVRLVVGGGGGGGFGESDSQHIRTCCSVSR